MGEMILAGFVIVIATLMMLSRFDLRKALGYCGVIDVGFTLVMFAMFSGTFSGIIASAFAGVFMTVMLSMLRGTIGCKKLQWVKVGRVPRLRWIAYGPELFRAKWYGGLA